MSNFEIFKSDLNDAVKISIIRANNIGNAINTNDVISALDAKVEEYVRNRPHQKFICNEPPMRVILEGISGLTFEEF